MEFVRLQAHQYQKFDGSVVQNAKNGRLLSGADTPALPKGELLCLFRTVRIKLPLSGELDLRSKDGEGWAALSAAQPLPKEADAAPVVFLHDPSRENAMPDSLRAVRHYSIKIVRLVIAASAAHLVHRRKHHCASTSFARSGTHSRSSHSRFAFSIRLRM